MTALILAAVLVVCGWLLFAKILAFGFEEPLCHQKRKAWWDQ